MQYSPKRMNDLLEENNFYLKKKFGQNFIIDENLIDSIVNKAQIDKDTLVLDIMEALVRDGFLSRTLDVNNVREAMMRNQTKVNEKLSNI